MRKTILERGLAARDHTRDDLGQRLGLRPQLIRNHQVGGPSGECGRRQGRFARGVQDGYPREQKASSLHRDPAGFAKEFVPALCPDNQRADAAEQGIDPVEPVHLDLRGLALSDIDDGAGHVAGLAVRAAQRLALDLRPAVAPRAVPGAELHLIGRRGKQVRVQRRLHDTQVLRVQQPQPRTPAVGDFLVCVAVPLLPLVRDVGFVGGDGPVPDVAR